VSAVAVTVLAAATKSIEYIGGAPAKLSVRGSDSRINDVGAHARPGPVVNIGSIEWSVPLVNTVQAPRRICLSCVGGDHAVLFDKLDSEIEA
jgi:hypothetical protein